MSSEKGCRKDKNQNIQVFVRLRPLNQRERDIKSLGVIDVAHNREVVVRLSQSSHTKKFTFDRAFGPNAKQLEIYQEVVSPLIEEVLAGYNCTVFAYGQTGTGKTHTMVGENTSDNTNWQDDPLAGIIPRALSQLFDELRISATEHTVRVSYLELYNEELFDLLSTSEDNSKLRIYEDVTRKGSNIVNGLEEITVSNKNEVYKIMAQGQERKRVASTLMNAQSSRSHTVFTIVVHMKENSPEGEELVKIGKLNLVDLAGSENISKAGSDNPAKKERARECVNINQSLLTLGRVITALVEKHPHIPYRESKLTRILQESLGGRTKTSIIATISPGHKDLEETMSTLEYANRAKNIQNKPEVNQKMTKKAILRQYAEEIDRLKKDLQAARDKNGVFLSNDTYTELTLKQEEQRKEIQELLLKKRAMEEEKEKMEGIFSEVSTTLETRLKELNAAHSELSSTKTKLFNAFNTLRVTQLQSEERAHLVERHQTTEAALAQQARDLLSAAEAASSHARALLESVDRRRSVESANLQLTRSYREVSSEHRAHIAAGAHHYTRALLDDVTGLHAALENFTCSSTATLRCNKTTLEQLVQNITLTMDELKSVTNENQQSLVSATECHRSAVKASLDRRQASVETVFTSLVQVVAACVQAAQSHNLPETLTNFLNQWYGGACERIESLQRVHSEFKSKLAESETARAESARTHRSARLAALDKRIEDINDAIAEIQEEKCENVSFMEQLEADQETERREAAARLQRWVQEETRLFEQRVQAHVQTQTEETERRLSQHANVMARRRARLEASLARREHALRAQLAATLQEVELAGRDQEAYDAGSQRSHQTLHEYNKEFDDDTTAVTVEMKALTEHVVSVARHVYSELLGALLRADQQIQNDTNAVATKDRAASDQFLADTEVAREKLLQDNQLAMDAILERVQANNSATVSTLHSLSTSADTLASAALEHVASHASTVHHVTSLTATFEDQLREAVERHAHLERKYLSEEYKVYSPTGSTPQRCEYRYPRALAATSPHQRILQRFRASRQHANEDHGYIVIESDPESRATSDNESLVSEDSSVFLAPSPRSATQHALRPPQEPGLLKSTSETDIYKIRRSQEQRGKENADHSMTNGTAKKRSKLRAPSSHKKPLVDRNGPN